MKVSKLIKLLSEVNQDAEVFLSSDPEGNSFKLFDEVYTDDGNLAFKKTDREYDFGVLEPDDFESPIYLNPAVILYP